MQNKHLEVNIIINKAREEKNEKKNKWMKLIKDPFVSCRNILRMRFLVNCFFIKCLTCKILFNVYLEKEGGDGDIEKEGGDRWWR